MKSSKASWVLLAKCEFCGKPDCISHKKYLDRCEECGKRYTKYSNYKSMQRSAPTPARQRLLDDIVDEYKTLRRLGYKVPRALQ